MDKRKKRGENKRGGGVWKKAETETHERAKLIWKHERRNRASEKIEGITKGMEQEKCSGKYETMWNKCEYRKLVINEATRQIRKERKRKPEEKLKGNTLENI